MSRDATNTKTLLVKLGALVAGLAVVGYVGLRLGEGNVSLHVPFLGSSAPAAHVVTPEEEVAAEIQANPSLVTRDACLNLYMNAPSVLTMLSHPSQSDFAAMPNDELRAIALDVVTTANGAKGSGLEAIFADNAHLATGLQRFTTFPRFANPNGAETRRVNAYLDTCRSIYPGRDEASANFIRVRMFALIRMSFNAGSLVDRMRTGR